MTEQVAEQFVPPQASKPILWKDYEKFVAKLSWQSARRAHACGLPLEFDDVFQEAALAFVRATKGFKPEMGFKFITYCGVAVTTRLANHIKSAHRQLIGRTISLDAKRGSGDDDGESLSVYGLLPSSEPDPLDELVLGDEIERSITGLGELGALMVEWILNPPPEVQEEMDGLRWKLAEMNRRGLRSQRLRNEFDQQFLFAELLPRLLPRSVREIRTLRAQVNRVVQAWNI